MKSFVTVAGIMFTMFLCNPYVYAADGLERVSVFSFDGDGAGKYIILQDSIDHAIVSGLAEMVDITYVENTLPDEEQERILAEYAQHGKKIFATLGIDWIVTGKYTLTDTILQFDATLYSDQGKSPVLVSSFAQNEGEVLPALDTLLEKIHERIVGADDQRISPAVSEKSGIKAFQTEHPERRYKEERVFQTEGNMPADYEERENVLTIYESVSPLQGKVVALSVADLDDDGVSEVVVVTEKYLVCYRYDQGQMHYLDVIRLGVDETPHALNIADTNGDGEQEIYLSSMQGTSLSSSMYSWNTDRGFSREFSDIPWAIRPIEIPGAGMILVGQQKNNSAGRFLKPRLWKLDIDEVGQKLVAVSEVVIPGRPDLFDFSFSDLDGDGKVEVIVLLPDFTLAVYSASGTVVWKSEEKYGESIEQTAENPGQNTGLDNMSIAMQYKPVRIVTDDMDYDGIPELFIARNVFDSSRMTGNLKVPEYGQIVCMKWQDEMMQQQWVTSHYDGYIADMVADISQNSIAAAQSAAASGMRLMFMHNTDDGSGGAMAVPAGKSELVTYEIILE